MADPRDISDPIRAFLAAGGGRWPDELADAADAYAALCREANDRTRRCADYLKAGMRSEAVHLADCPPKLADLVAWLELPDPAAWEKACAAAGLSPPPRPRRDGLSGLQAAAAREAELSPLLARHRALALAQSPIAERLEILRALSDRDPENPCWAEGLRGVEAVRLKEIRTAAKAAHRGQDETALKALADELFGQHWRSDVPEDLRVGLEKALSRTRLDATLAGLHAILAELVPAHDARSYDATAAAMARWQAVVASGKVTVPPFLQEKVRPAAAWLAAEDRRRAARQRLQAAQAALQPGGVTTTRDYRQILIYALLAAGVLGVGVLVYAYLNHAQF